MVTGAVRGRGAGLNPANRFDGVRLHVLGETLDDARREHPEGVQVPTLVAADATRHMINRVDSPDLSFNWTLNPYRGCEHGCVYCYARPTHEFLGYSCGLDFETRIIAKHDAPALLQRELANPKWAGEPIVMSGVTDAYQPIEREFNITRACLEVLAECGQPVSIVTKNRLVTRDIDKLQRLARVNAANVAISVTTLDAKLAGSMEPRASCPADRLRAIRELSDAGIPVMVIMGPIIPGLTDREIPRLLEAAAEAGAQNAIWLLLRLPHQVKDLFADWLGRYAPDRARHVLSLMAQCHGGELYDSAFGSRARGKGAFAEQIRDTFRLFARRHGLDRPLPPLSSEAFVHPEIDDGQLRLFGRS